MSENTKCYGLAPCAGCDYCRDPWNQLHDNVSADPTWAVEEIVLLRKFVQRFIDLADGPPDMEALIALHDEAVALVPEPLTPTTT